MSGLTFDPARTAVLAMDFQTAIMANHGAGREDVLATTATVLAAARRKAMRVIYVIVGFRPGFPEVSPRNQGFSTIKARGGIPPEIHPLVAPAPEDIIVTKHRVGAFQGTDMDMILRANDIDTLVLSGVATRGVVLSTLRYAADLDYRLYVLKDCCADQFPDVHACLMDKVFPMQAGVITSGDFIQALGR